MPHSVLFIGPAGCGKTSLTDSFGRWLEQELGHRVAYINLDPGCLTTPYKPAFDIRNMFTVSQLMREENLGPNGAMIRAAELMEARAREIAGLIAELEEEFVLIDTPGQMEIFVFREAGPRISQALRGRAVAVYIADPSLASSATGLSVAVSLAIATKLRLGISAVMVLNKSDIMQGLDVDRLLQDFDYLKERILAEGLGAVTDLALRYADMMRELSEAARLVKVSAKTGEGMDILYDLINEVFCVCGDLT